MDAHYGRFGDPDDRPGMTHARLNELMEEFPD
jgi:hypothetical protein